MRAVGRTARYFRETQADLVHAHLPLAGVVGRLAGRVAGVPVVYTEHNPTDSYHPVTQALSRATWGLQECAIAISPDVAASMRRHGGDRAPIQTVLNGIDTDAFTRSDTSRPEARARIGLPAGSPVVGVVAQFRLQKQLDVWVATAHLIRQALPDVRFVIVGSGELWDDVRGVASKLGLDDVLHFAGAQPDVRPYVEAMDVFMMTSKYEGAPLAPVEAMSMRVPVVAMAVEGIRNVIRTGENGVLVPPGPDASGPLAREVVALLRDPGAMDRLGRAGRESAVRSYGLVQMQRTLESLYEDVLATGKGAPMARGHLSPWVGGAGVSTDVP